MEEIAQVYARSLFEVATEHDKLDLVREQLGAVRRCARRSRTSCRCSSSRPTSPPRRSRTACAKAVTGADEAFVNFLSLLLENHRMPVIFRVRREYDRLWEEANKLLPVQITSAVELDPSVAQRVGDEIGRQTGVPWS